MSLSSELPAGRGAWPFLRSIVPAGLLGILVLCIPLKALECDQFTLPRHPLVDSGPLLSHRVYYLLQYIVRLGNNEFGKISDSERLDEGFPADRLFRALGRGVPEASVESWLHFEEFPQQPMRHKVSVWNSIFRGVFSPLPFSFVPLAPTLNLYGVLLGTDKPGHLFQQGYAYYEHRL